MLGAQKQGGFIKSDESQGLFTFLAFDITIFVELRPTAEAFPSTWLMNAGEEMLLRLFVDAWTVRVRALMGPTRCGLCALQIEFFGGHIKR